jgi:hypothetical protein
MKRLLTLGLMAAALAGLSSPPLAAPLQPAKTQTLRGHLMPFKCQNDEKVSHTRDCALRPECRITGYGVALPDGTFQQFDEDGNKKAVELLESSRTANDLQVEAEGERVGSLFRVRTLRLK